MSPKYAGIISIAIIATRSAINASFPDTATPQPLPRWRQNPRFCTMCWIWEGVLFLCHKAIPLFPLFINLTEIRSYLQDLKDANVSLEKVRICYSPFSRTAHTAKVVASVLNLPFEGSQSKVIEDLRERYFGPTYELASHDRYPEIWALDEKDPFEKPEEGGESAADVVSRLVKAMEQIETMFEGCAILIVSHGDPLQMLQTILNAAKEHNESTCSNFLSKLEAVKVPSVLSKHRKFALETGELRAVV